MRFKSFAVLSVAFLLAGCPSPPAPTPSPEAKPVARPAATVKIERPVEKPKAPEPPKKIEKPVEAPKPVEPAPAPEPEPTPAPEEKKPASRIPADAVSVKVVKCIDGDTITVLFKGKEEKVRMKGVDTPETVHPQKPVERFGKEASNFTKKRLSGQTIKLELDNGGARDKYGRLLAFIWMEDGTCHNETLVAEGYAHAYTRYPFDRMEDYRRLEKEAREKKRGLWGD